jgi:hypothetical protein
MTFISIKKESSPSLESKELKDKVNEEKDHGIPHQEVPQRVEQVQVQLLGRVPGVLLKGLEIDLLLAAGTHVLLPYDRPALDALKVEAMSAVEHKESLGPNLALARGEPANGTHVGSEVFAREACLGVVAHGRCHLVCESVHKVSSKGPKVQAVKEHNESRL